MDILGGGTPKTNRPDYWNGGIPWLSVKDFNNDYRYVYKTEKTITEAGLNSSATQLLRRNDIIISARGTVGAIAMIPFPMAFNQSCYGLRGRPKLVDQEFLYYLVKYNIHALQKNTHGSVFDTITRDTFAGIEVNLPSLAKQEAIAGILKSLDDKIEFNNQINENLYQQLFALYDYYCDSADGSEVELGALCQFQEGYVNPAQTHPEYFDGDVKWLRAVDINESFIIETSRTLTQTGFQSAKRSAYLFSPNTIAISKSGTIGRLGIVADYMCGNRAVINIAPKDSFLLPYIYAFLKSHQKEFPDLAVGSVQKNLYVSLLEPLLVRIPDSDTLSEFCNVGNAILNTVSNNCRENIRLAQLRDTLLPRLMSGELDVSDIDL